MKSKYVLVTASSKGLGLEIAKQLSYNGYNIILTSRDMENLKLAKKSLNPDLKHKVIKIDLSKDNIEKKLIQKIDSLNIVSVIHNFGLKLDKDNHPIDINILEQSIYNNFIVSLKINNGLNKKLLKNIIYIGSTASLHAKSSPSYTLSKSLINTYVKNSAADYLTKGITISALLPGVIAHKGSEWDMKKTTEPLKYENMKQSYPFSKFALPNDIAPYVVDMVKQKSYMHAGVVLKLDANNY